MDWIVAPLLRVQKTAAGAVDRAVGPSGDWVLRDDDAY